jgi:hypothetical protein
MDETGFTQTMPATSGSKINSSNMPHADDDFDDTFGDFNDFEAGNDDFGDFAAGTATSPQPVDGFGAYQHDDTIPKSDFHASDHDIHGDFSVNDEARQEMHKEEEGKSVTLGKQGAVHQAKASRSHRYSFAHFGSAADQR